MLPFGIITDVSAGALAAGSGGLQNVVKPMGGSTAPSSFESELNALSGLLSGGDGASADGEEAVGGEFVLPFDAVFEERTDEPVLALGAEVPGESVPAAPALPGSAAPTLPVNPQLPPEQPSASNDPGALAGVASQEPRSGLPQVPAGKTAPAPVFPEMPDVAASSMTSSFLAPQTGKTVDHRNAGQPVPPQVTEPVVRPPVVVASSIQPTVSADVTQVAPLPVGPVPVESAGAQPIAVPPTSPSDVTAHVAPVKAPAERRWQVELPTELRATSAATSSPVVQVAQRLEPLSQPVLPQAPSKPAVSPGSDPSAPKPLPVQATLATPAPTSEQAVVSAPASASAPVSATAPASASGTTPSLAPAPIPAPQPGAAVAPLAGETKPSPVATPVADEVPAPMTSLAKKSSGGGPAELAEPGAKPVVVAAPLRAAPQTMSDGAGQSDVVPLKIDPPLSEELQADGQTPVKVPETGKEAKSSSAMPSNERPAQSATMASGPDASANAATAGGESKPAQGAPAAAAFLASQLVLDDASSSGQPLELSLTGEFGATVRGGDLSGAVRTDSLQTPSQAQSGQVSMQVAAEIARNLKNGQTRFQMRFDPPELGRVEVNMRVGADGGVHAHLIVERPETLDMFLRDQRSLERALEAAGLNADSENLQFSLKQDGGRGFASGDGQSEQASDPAHGQDEPGADDAEADGDEVVHVKLAARPGGLDLKI